MRLSQTFEIQRVVLYCGMDGRLDWPRFARDWPVLARNWTTWVVISAEVVPTSAKFGANPTHVGRMLTAALSVGRKRVFWHGPDRAATSSSGWDAALPGTP